MGIVGCLSRSEEPVGSNNRLTGQACDCQGEDQGLPGERPGPGPSGDESAATLDAPQGVCHHATSVKHGVHRVRHVVVPTAFDSVQPRLAIATKIIDPPRDSALRGHHVKRRKPRVVDCPGRLDQLLGPSDRLVLPHPVAQEGRENGDSCCGVDVAAVRGPSECVAQVR